MADRVIHTDICFKYAPVWGPHLNLPLHTSKIHLCTDSLATMINDQRNNTFPSYNCCNTLIQPVRVDEHYVALREIMSMDWINEIGIPFAYIEVTLLIVGSGGQQRLCLMCYLLRSKENGPVDSWLDADVAKHFHDIHRQFLSVSERIGFTRRCLFWLFKVRAKKRLM